MFLLSESVVGWDAVIAASLHVEGGQVQAPILVGVLEQVVRHLLGHGSVHSLRHLVHQTANVLVAIAALVHVVRLTQHFAQSLSSWTQKEVKIFDDYRI